MKSAFKHVLLLLAAVVEVIAQCPGGKAPANSIKPVVAAGWKWSLVAFNLQKPRSIAFDASGNLIVVEGGFGVTALQLTDDKGICVREERRKVIIFNSAVSTLESSLGRADSLLCL